MAAATDLAEHVGVAPACAALGVPRASYYRNRAPLHGPAPRRPAPARALTRAENETALAHLYSPRFQDRSPAQVFATLLDEGLYVCSPRSMYRLLSKQGQARERRSQLTHPPYQKPELSASGPNQLWSWDITRLLGPAKWTYFYLYVILDVFSRHVVGWMVAYAERAALASQLLESSCRKQLITAGQLTIHADNGSSMTSKPVAFLLSDLGVTKTHSRPHVSNDNPYSESNFKTLKYRPDFPSRFGSIQDARVFAREFFDWYNNDHRHSGISMLTPAMLHYGQADAVIAKRQAVLDSAFSRHPERFAKPPVSCPAPKHVWINKPAENTAGNTQ